MYQLEENMRELCLDEIRVIQLEMLNDFHEFCNINNLRYFLDAGTLIGAIRHNGFIPWDDDVDVAMPRKDYDRFIEIAQKGYKNSILHLPLDSIESYLKILDKRTVLIESPNSINRIIGVYIDVYPKDGIKNLGFLSEVQCKLVELLLLKNYFNKVCIKTWPKKESLLKRFIAFVGKLITFDKDLELKIALKICKIHTFDESKYSATIESGGMKNCVQKKDIDKYALHQFENLLLNIPTGFNVYLEKLYGNYMTLPPPSQRKSHHDFIAFMRTDDFDVDRD
jgi:lipopolysaccharide cholinephosphotransferase